MRYTIILIIFCLSSTISFAQETPDYNLDFEQWVDSSMRDLHISIFNGNAKKGYLKGWFEHGFKVRTTDAVHGDYAMVIYDWYGLNYDYIVLGERGIYVPRTGECVDCGTSINFRPEEISFAYKGILNEDATIDEDTVVGFVNVMLTKYDSVNGQRDTIGIGKINLYPTSDTYKTYSFPIQYTSHGVPDSIIFYIVIQIPFIGGRNCNSCIFLFFDNFQFHRKGTSIISPDEKSLLHIYPNPLDKSELNIYNKTASRFISVKIYNSTGVFISELTIPPHSRKMYSMSGLENGIYYLKGEERTYKVVHY